MSMGAFPLEPLIGSSTQSIYKRVLSACCAPGPVLGAGDTAVRKTAGPPWPSRSFISGGDRPPIKRSHIQGCSYSPRKCCESGAHSARRVQRNLLCPSPRLRQQHLVHTAQPETRGRLPSSALVASSPGHILHLWSQGRSGP